MLREFKAAFEAASNAAVQYVDHDVVLCMSCPCCCFVWSLLSAMVDGVARVATSQKP